MTAPSPDITIEVDLRNSGQFFACCGLLELAARKWPGSLGWFAHRDRRPVFHVATSSGDESPLLDVVRTICEADPFVELAEDHEAYDQADRQPVTLSGFGDPLRLDWWLDSYRGLDKSELKVWAGQQTPLRNISSLRKVWRDLLRTDADAAAGSSLFCARAPLKGRFGFDPAASWESIDVGFSPDEQDLPVQTSPATEILAAVGLQRCRPVVSREKRRWFKWRAWADPIEIAVAPAAVAGVGRAIARCEFPVVMRNAQYGNFGWARPVEETR